MMSILQSASNAEVPPNADTEGKPRSSKRVGDEAVVVGATGIVSVFNYGYTLILLWLLPTREFAEVGSISALLLICGTISGAALPWVLAQEVLRSKDDPIRRRIAVTFCIFATMLQGAAAGLATCLIAVHYSSGPVLAAAFCSVFLIFMGATAAGYFQGMERFRLIAILKVAEVMVKLGAGLALIALGAGASGAIAGFALGAGVVTAVGLAYMAPNISWSRTALAGRNLWASTRGLMAIQAGVAVLASMDVVIGSLVLGASPALATYQAANIIGRVPVFIGTALSIVIFPRMIAGRSHPRVVIRDSVLLYIKVCAPITVVAATLPPSITGALFPARYGDVGGILPWASVAGLVMGVVNMTTTYFQAAGLFRRTSSLLALGVAFSGVLDVLGLEMGGIVGLAVAVAIGAAFVAVALMREITRTWPGALQRLLHPFVMTVVLCLPLILLRGHLVIWMIWAMACGLLLCLRGLMGVSETGSDGPEPPRQRVLHLGYEDPRRPRSGGGSVRTHAINERMTDMFDITVVCARYKGAKPRVEDGVRYVHLGVAGADVVERLSYFAMVPYALVRYRSDLVVEDFGAPLSSVAVPWMTARPVLGVVQWLFAREKSHQYHLPFHLFEGVGLHSHRSLIAVSDDLGRVLASRNPRAEVTVIANGLDVGECSDWMRERSGIAYLGRLENAQKGLDLLLDAYSMIAGLVDQDLFLAGDGPDRRALEAQAAELGIAHRVHFVGRLAAVDRFEWLAGSDIVAMPSRYETFGMVAAEALAVRTPVVAFDIPCLRALVDEGVGARVPAFDVESFADSLRDLCGDEERRRTLGSAGPSRVAALNWDDLALRQAKVYRQLIDGPEYPPTEDQAGSAEACGRRMESESSEQGLDQPVPSLSVIALLQRQWSRTPHHTAVFDGESAWSYNHLRQVAVAFAASIAQRGVRSCDGVAICLPRSPLAIAAMIGVWLAGATYVPLDPEYPPNRLASMVKRAGVVLAVGDPMLLTKVDPNLPVISPDTLSTIDVVGDASGAVAKATPQQQSQPFSISGEPVPDSIAYVLFTSGSAGQPKAVEIEHRSLSCVLEWIRSTLTEDDLRATVTSISFSFDPFIIEVLGPLIMGGSVHTIPSALALTDVDSGPTLIANTPSVLRELHRAGRLPSTLRTVISGGEILPPELANDLLGTGLISRLINTYGPTESTVLATSYEVTLPVEHLIPIGHDLPGATIQILDEDLNSVADGGIGEICISGTQVARGYRGDPEATHLRFVEIDGQDGKPVRIYRTGDLGSRRSDGAVEFRGRMDRQLKLRGFRIEPGEVEAELCRHPEVLQAAVTASGDGSKAVLVAYVTTLSPSPSSSELRTWLRESLPPYMVPSHVMILPSMPVNANGKVALDLLPSLVSPTEASHPRPPGVGTVDASLADPVVSRIAALTRSVLGFEGSIYPTDDILEDLGASSLTLFQLLAAIEEEFSCTVEIGRVLEDATVAGLAAMVGYQTIAPRHLSVNADGTKQPIFMVHGYLGTALRYRRLGQVLSSERPLVGLQVQEFDSAAQQVRTSVAQLADEAVTRIRSFQAEGPYLLGGHSAGGLIAYEAARRLVSAGEKVDMVVLIDSPVPRSVLHYLWAETVLNWPDIRSGQRSERRRQIRTTEWLRVSRFRSYRTNNRVGTTVMRSYRASKEAVRKYRPGCYPGALTVMRTSQGAIMALGRTDLGWRSVASGPIAFVEIPGLHNSIFDSPQLEFVGQRLDEVLERVDRSRFSASAGPTKA